MRADVLIISSTLLTLIWGVFAINMYSYGNRKTNNDDLLISGIHKELVS